jgi:L-alanine-DL-glutamate epimerase-like enolase superfamily enzyme
MTNLELRQLSRELKETMYISRGGFDKRVHNFIVLDYNNKEFVAEIIGDAKLIKACIEHLFEYIRFYKRKEFTTPQYIFDATLEWERSFVYLEDSSSIQAIVNAFDWLRLTLNTYIENKSMFELLGIKTPTKKKIRVYGSNIYWKEENDEFEHQLNKFDFKKTNIVKAHLGRNNYNKERDKYKILARNPNIQGFMVDINCGYTSEQFKQLCGEIQRDGEIMEKLIWIEEPMKPKTDGCWKDIADNIALAAGENHHGLIEMVRLMEKGIQWIMPDIGRTLRVSEYKDLIESSKKHKTNISLHSYSSGILAYTSMMLLLSLNDEEVLYEHDFSGNAIMDEIIGELVEFKEGYAHIEIIPVHEISLKYDSSWTKEVVVL